MSQTMPAKKALLTHLPQMSLGKTMWTDYLCNSFVSTLLEKF